jgi:Domain of unknown function (DUF3597)
MGIFGAILDKLRHLGHPQAQTTAGKPTAAPGQQTQDARGSGAQQSSTLQPGAAPMSNVDVEAVMTQLASKKGGGGNWRTSIVDTMKLLDLDSSLDARKQLAEELNVHAGAHGSAEQNIALQKALMRKIAENGGKVPDSLKD